MRNLNLLENNKTVLRFIGWFYFANTILYWLLGFSYLKAIFSSGTLFLNSMVNFSSIPGKLFVILFAMTNYFSYMMLLAFIPAFFIFALAFVIPFDRFKRFFILLNTLVASIGLLLLVCDIRIFALFKFHINTTVISLIFEPEWRVVFDLSHYEITLMCLFIVLILSVELIIANLIWKRIKIQQVFYGGRMIGIAGLSGVLISYSALVLSLSDHNNLLIQQTPNLPFYNRLLTLFIASKEAKENVFRLSEHHLAYPLFPTAPLHYPLHPLQCKAPQIPYNVILIMTDALRADVLQDTNMPNVSSFAKQSWQFQHQTSGGNSTQPGLFSLFYSIPSNYWTAALEQKQKPVLMSLLENYHYASHIFWSTEMRVPPFDKTIFLGINNLKLDGYDKYDIGQWDRDTTKRAIQFLTKNKRPSQQPRPPFFMNIFYNATHAYCAEQNYPTPFQPTQKHCARLFLSNDHDPKLYFNRYLNSVKFVDGEIGQILTLLKEQGYLKNSIVIITSDHGEEFNDNQQNYWGHTSNYTKTQVQVPLIIYWPNEKPRLIQYPTSSYDVVPTLLTRLFSCKNPTIDYSIGQDLLSPNNRLPFILSGSYINMGVIEPDRLTILETSGRITVTTPQAKPVEGAEPRKKILNQVFLLMRHYFKNDKQIL